MKRAYAAVNFTMSSGLKPSPGRPPIVPRMPEMDLISDICNLYNKICEPKMCSVYVLYLALCIADAVQVGDNRCYFVGHTGLRADDKLYFTVIVKIIEWQLQAFAPLR